MNIIENIKNLFTTTKQSLDIDKDGKQLYKEDIIAEVLEKLETRRNERKPLEQQWILNSNFLVGNQYCDINTYRGEIEQLEPVYDWLEREPFNRIAPLIETRIANLKRIKFLMTCKPRTNELDDFAKAEVSTAIIRHKQKTSDFDSKKNTMILWNELCGSCFWLSWWDKDAGEEYGRKEITVVGEDGVEYKKEVAVYEGDLDYGLITPYEIYPESIFKQKIKDQRFIILEQVKTVQDIYDTYGIEVEGTEIDTFALTPIPSGGGYGYENTVNAIGHRTINDAQKVITYMERPSRYRPGGRLIIIVGDEHLVYYGDLPYGSIPIEQVVCKEVAGQFFGKSVIEDLIPLQRAYNGCVNRIHEFIKRVAIQEYMIEEGSIDIEEYEENGVAPGAMLVYKHGSEPPKPIPNGQLPSELLREKDDLKNDMEYVAGVSQLMVIGSTPSGVTSGTAIESLREIDNTRLSLTGDHIRNSVKNLAKTWLEIYKRYATAHRVMLYVGSNSIGDVIVWSNEDISIYDIEYDTANELELSEEMQRQNFLQAFQMGAFTDEEGRIPRRIKQKVIESMKVGNFNDVTDIDTLQTQAAQRENVFFENGVIPEISEIDDHEIHAEEHKIYMLQMKFQLLKMKKPQYAEALMAHLKQHEAILAERAQREMAQMLAMGSGNG